MPSLCFTYEMSKYKKADSLLVEIIFYFPTMYSWKVSDMKTWCFRD